MKKLYGAIVWHVHTDEDGNVTNRFLALEKRNGLARYPGQSYCTFITGPNFTDLTDSDIDRMREWARNSGITLTTDRVVSRIVS